ncbi:(d)CMP kinase [Bengtsoniella intestinalis]|uniref:(d)CMP kinase n=1 Tax=Bengtsoniella intestinalis TaxID=3073143 RepID=UPI00391F0390
MMTIAIAIDGPSGAGKSTLAKTVAAKLGYLYVDTGAIYRTIGYYMYANAIAPKDSVAVEAALPKVQAELRYLEDGIQHMFLNGEDVSTQIRLPEMSRYASYVSGYGFVRDFLLEVQRDLARRHNVIMDGRDIATVVLPDAQVKIFLTASPETRANRRCKELVERGTPQPYEQVLQEIIDRDKIDMERDIAPLRQAEDACLLDTSNLNFQESTDAILKLIGETV